MYYFLTIYSSIHNLSLLFYRSTNEKNDQYLKKRNILDTFSLYNIGIKLCSIFSGHRKTIRIIGILCLLQRCCKHVNEENYEIS